MKRYENGVLVDMTPEEITAHEADQAGYVPPPKTKLFKSSFVERCDEAELTTLRNHLATENIKFQEMYAACDYFLADDPLFAVLHWTVAQLLGEAKADELLEMEL